MKILKAYSSILYVAITMLLAPRSAVAIDTFNLVPDLPTNQPLGTTITWSVVGSAINYDFRLDVGLAGEGVRPIYAYTVRHKFQWTPKEEGLYNVVATVRNLVTRETTQLFRTFYIRPRAFTVPTVSATGNALVALYSAPACNAPNQMLVTFVPSGGGQRFTTPPKPCDSNKTMNFLLAGMTAETTYIIRHLLLNAQGNLVRSGPLRQFTSGTPPVALPAVSVNVPPTSEASTNEPVLLAGPTFGSTGPFAADTSGNIIWYYENTDGTQFDFLLTRLLPGGTILMIARTADVDRFKLRQIDLAGNTLRETNARWLTEQYFSMGGTDVIPALHHEGRLLPNGQFILLGTIERLLEDVQGPGIVDVIGDIILSIDQDWNLTWAWNAFDHLDVTRLALQGETCVSNGPGCPIIFLADEANDWMHANAIGYSPSDGNLILSIRHQDWVTKIDYQYGSGTGTVLWKLGNEGDFLFQSDDINASWFSHQHDSNYLGNNRVILYDNGNGNPACLADPVDCKSRGQVYNLDENLMTAELVTNADLQNYSQAVGAAQQLGNGNYVFNSGIVDGGPTAKSDEVTPDGTIVFSLGMDSRIYRSFRLRDLYTPPSYQ
jgi:hypothetical protein